MGWVGNCLACAAQLSYLGARRGREVESAHPVKEVRGRIDEFTTNSPEHAHFSYTVNLAPGAPGLQRTRGA